MSEPRSYTYRVLKGPWGIQVSLTAKLAKDAEDLSALIQITGSLFMTVSPPLAESLGTEAIGQLRKGFVVASMYLPGEFGAAGAIVIDDVRFVESDFQEDGLAAATYGWLGEALGISLPDIPVVFDRTVNRYIFGWP